MEYYQEGRELSFDYRRPHNRTLSGEIVANRRRYERKKQIVFLTDESCKV